MGKLWKRAKSPFEELSPAKCQIVGEELVNFWNFNPSGHNCQWWPKERETEPLKVVGLEGFNLQQTSLRFWRFLNSVSVIVSCWRAWRRWFGSYVHCRNCSIFFSLIHTFAVVVSVVLCWFIPTITCAFGLGAPEKHTSCSGRTNQPTLTYLQICIFKSIWR